MVIPQLENEERTDVSRADADAQLAVLSLVPTQRIAVTAAAGTDCPARASVVEAENALQPPPCARAAVSASVEAPLQVPINAKKPSTNVQIASASSLALAIAPLVEPYTAGLTDTLTPFPTEGAVEMVPAPVSGAVGNADPLPIPGVVLMPAPLPTAGAVGRLAPAEPLAAVALPSIVDS
jgi:hypothetical protein